MPLLEHRCFNSQGELGLWRITETEEWFTARLKLHAEEEQQLDRIKGDRRREWLAARHLVHLMSGRTERTPFYKDEHGKPYLKDSDWHISISHSGKLSAAIAAPFHVGIDVQHFVSKIDRIASRFMSEAELENLSSKFRLEHMHVYWGAKEALYKIYGRKKLNFRNHILISPFEYKKAGGIFKGRIVNGHFDEIFELHYEMLAQNMLVYAKEF